MSEPARHESTRVHNNRFGFRGVEWDNERKKFRARIEPANGQRGRWLGRFDTAEAAARAYDNAAREVYDDEAFLNFPGPGEKQAIASQRRRSLCPNGHDLDEHGYVRPDGRGINCRACNSEASKRSYRRRKELPNG